jgi:hypothetical protein
MRRPEFGKGKKFGPKRAKVHKLGGISRYGGNAPSRGESRSSSRKSGGKGGRRHGKR